MSGMHWSLLGLLILIEGLLLILLGRESGLLGTILLSSVTAVGGLWLPAPRAQSIKSHCSGAQLP